MKTSKKMAVNVTINSITLKTSAGPTLFECAEKLGVRVPTSCVKQGKCRECLVEVTEGADVLSPRSEEELHLQENFRLSCRAQIVSPNGTLNCHTLRRGTMRIEESSTCIHQESSWQPDPAVTRGEGNQILLDGTEIDLSTGPIYGLAVDLGTTTVVIRLVDLENGQIVATQSFENPQRFAGSDVMSRIHFDSENPGRLLRRTLIGYMNHAIEDFPCPPDSIYETVIVGNPTMRDIFFGLNVYSIGQRPYRSITELEFRKGSRVGTQIELTGRKSRLSIHRQGRVYGLPLIGSHVGADAASCLLAVDFLEETGLVAIMDIGTNTELIVGNTHRALAASCPAGPAFEGGGVTCGMPGLDGAIESVQLGDNSYPRVQVIGGKTPEGICGSGLVELLGELLRTEQMNSAGRLTNHQPRFPIVEEKSIFLSENDISELAQAKGANVSGLQIIFKRYGMEFRELDRFYLAGGFARHLDLISAKRIGLIPDLPKGKIIQLGNAAIEGATRALLSISRRHRLEKFVAGIEHVELETDPEFFDFFVDGCQFIPIRSPKCLS
jgi:uncharacterized 2Fe-2S/4Fe-4S cluster protein (DUF4445 family)